jgi:N-dimethylarginine dimethylaminohydrolase
MSETRTAAPPIAETDRTWGSDSETGRLREVLVCPPHSYRWLPTSAFSRATLDSGARFDPAEAAAQHAQLVDALRGAEVECSLIEQDEALPYQVFMRDSCVITPAGLVATQPSQPWRRGEAIRVADFAQERGPGVWHSITAGSLEGGDFVMVEPGHALIGSGEGRTSYEGAQQLAGWLRGLDWEVRVEPIPGRYVHIDVLICMVAPRLALVCEDAISSGLARWLRERKVETIAVDMDELMELGANALALGDDRVISAAEAPALNQRMRARGLTVLDPELSSFLRGGGGPHCLTQPLRRDAGG